MAFAGHCSLTLGNRDSSSSLLQLLLGFLVAGSLSSKQSLLVSFAFIAILQNFKADCHKIAGSFKKKLNFQRWLINPPLKLHYFGGRR